MWPEVLWILPVIALFGIWHLLNKRFGSHVETPEPIIVPVQDTTQLLALTEQLGSSHQQVKFLEATIDTLSHQVATLEVSLENITTEAKKQKGRAQSAHTSKGQILEKWAPFVEHDQIDPHWRAEDWCFLGQPIDYVVFDWHQDKEVNMDGGKVVLLDVKAAKSQLTTKQRRIRDLIKAGKVEWREIRLD